MAPSTYRRWLSMVRYWNRLLLFDDTRLTKRVFNMDYNKGVGNWCSDIKDVMTKLDLLRHYQDKTIISLDEAKSNVLHYFSNIWQDGINRVPKLRTYVTFKTQFKQENYLQLNFEKK